MTRTLSALSNDQIARVAPSVFATQPWSGTSDRYTFVSTSDIVENLRREGLVPVSARQSRTSNLDKKGFMRHELRFVAENTLETRQVGDTFSQVVLTNSHDTGSAFAIDAGLFRLVCSNGMAVPDGIAQSVRVRHSGRLDDVIEGVFSVVEASRELPQLIEEYSSIMLPRPAQLAFATAALELRESSLPLEPEQLLGVRRWDDKKDDLWTVTNRIQENLTKGGLRSRSSTGRRASTRAVTDIAGDLKLNKAIFVLAEQLKASMH
jgi:hypothetical protein